MVLSLVSQRKNKNILLPDRDALKKCMEVATNPDSANYLCEQFADRLKKAKVFEASQNIYEAIQEFRQNIYLQYAIRDNPWNPNTEVTNYFTNFQRNIADLSSFYINNQIEDQPIQMDFTITEDAKLLRGYAINGNFADENLTKELDRLFNTFLARGEDPTITEDSILYKINHNGEIVQDSRGNKVKADVEQTINTINNSIEEYCKDHGINLNINYRNYEEEKQQQANVVSPEKKEAPVKKTRRPRKEKVVEEVAEPRTEIKRSKN